MTTLVFDCDGVLADTERYGHLPAFNATFREFGLPVQWSDEEYARKVLIGGGKERMTSLLTPEFVAAAGLPSDPAEQAAHVARWHKRKTELYVEIVNSGEIPPRPGIPRIIAEAAEAGWTLAVASTSAEPSVRSVLVRAAGEELAKDFAVFAGDIVAHKKPAPDIYELAVSELRAEPLSTLVVEDSGNGLRAALGAGLTCVVTTSSYTRHEDFTGAALVVSSLGDPGSDPIEVIDDPRRLRPGPYVRLTDLRGALGGDHAH